MAEKTMIIPMQLEQFALTEFSLRLVQGPGMEKASDGRFQIGFDLAKIDLPAPFKVVLRVEHSFLHQETALVEVRAVIVGFFKLPPELTAAQADTLLKINGLSMLYGALRGLVLSFSGAFPPGVRCILPTVNMAQVVSEAEAEAAAQKKGQKKDGLRKDASVTKRGRISKKARKTT